MLARPYEATSAEGQMIKWRFDWDKAAESTAKIYRAFMPPSAQVVRHQDRVGTGSPNRWPHCRKRRSSSSIRLPVAALSESWRHCCQRRLNGAIVTESPWRLWESGEGRVGKRLWSSGETGWA